MKRIPLNLNDLSSTEKAISSLEDFQKWLTQLVRDIVKEASELGVSIATINFSNAIYAGVNDASVSAELKNDGKTATITANGESVLFIEFGTGIFKASAPEEEAEIISGYVIPHGSYGQGKGSNQTGWAFEGSISGIAPSDTQFIRGGVYHTYGNDANSSLWNAKNELMNRIPDIARRLSK